VSALTLELYLSKENTNTKNVLYNISVVNARLSNAIAKALNLQKNVVESISEEINRVSQLNVDINALKSRETDQNKKVNFGKTPAEALQLLEAMKALDVNNLDALIATAKGGGIPQVGGSDVGLWAQQLNAVSERLSSKSQQETLRIQTFTSRYTQATDQATNVVQKDGQSKSTIIQNFRS
jgi:cell division GTPase FtsZ